MPVSQVVQVIRSSASVSRLSSFLELLWSSEIWLEIAYMYTSDMSFNSIAAFSNCPDVDLDWLNWPNLTTCLFWEFSISLTITFSLAKVVFLTPGEGTTSIGWNPGCPRTPQVTSKVCYQKTKPNCICFPQFFNHIFLHMSRKYINVFNEEYVLDQWEAFSHGCVVLISFHFLLQSSEFYWPFGLVFW